MSMREEGHLGGYIEGGDEATFYPDLWDWLVDHLGVRYVVDVGCGDGVAVKHFESRGCIVLGIDGVPQEHPMIHTHDFTKGPMPVQPIRADLLWSCEFVEHVEERYVENFLATFAVADLVLLTHAEPGQPGYHHVNCQPDTYWIAQLLTVGLVFDLKLTTTTRRLAAKNENPWNHYVRSGLAFRRPERLVSGS